MDSAGSQAHAHSDKLLPGEPGRSGHLDFIVEYSFQRYLHVEQVSCRSGILACSTRSFHIYVRNIVYYILYIVQCTMNALHNVNYICS